MRAVFPWGFPSGGGGLVRGFLVQVTLRAAAASHFFTVAEGLACPCHRGTEMSDLRNETPFAGIVGTSGSLRQLESVVAQEHRGPAASMDAVT